MCPFKITENVLQKNIANQEEQRMMLLAQQKK